jgi:hypothetical protein
MHSDCDGKTDRRLRGIRLEASFIALPLFARLLAAGF